MGTKQNIPLAFLTLLLHIQWTQWTMILVTIAMLGVVIVV